MKKTVIAAMLAVMLFTGRASAEIAGALMMYDSKFVEEQSTSELYRDDLSRLFFVGIDISKTEFRPYDSLNSMLLALEKGDIDYLNVPRYVGRYILENNRDLILKGISWYTINMADTLHFGVLEKNAELLKNINEAIAAMKKDGMLPILEKFYTDNYGLYEQPAVRFENFADAPTLTAALTGDIPPVDYVDGSGNPAGFNVAVLAEIGRRLHMNIKTLNIDTGARVAALTSGRADIVFWFRGNLRVWKGNPGFVENPEGVIFSEPYYASNEFYFIGKK